MRHMLSDVPSSVRLSHQWDHQGDHQGDDQCSRDTPWRGSGYEFDPRSMRGSVINVAISPLTPASLWRIAHRSRWMAGGWHCLDRFYLRFRDEMLTAPPKKHGFDINKTVENLPHEPSPRGARSRVRSELPSILVTSLAMEKRHHHRHVYRSSVAQVKQCERVILDVAGDSKKPARFELPTGSQSLRDIAVGNR